MFYVLNHDLIQIDKFGLFEVIFNSSLIKILLIYYCIYITVYVPSNYFSLYIIVEVNGGVPILVSLTTGAAVLLLLIMICSIIICKRRKTLSRTVSIPPPMPRPDLADHAALLHHPDRLALIAFAEGIQNGQVKNSSIMLLLEF